MAIRGYYFITDAGLSRAGNLHDVKNALAAGVKIVQYRDKREDSRGFFQEALRLRKLCRGITFLVNDRVDIALAVGADGVHLGQQDLPYAAARRLLGRKRIIGLSVNGLQQAKEAERLGADYLGVGPIFSTRTKEDAGLPTGVGLIRQIKKNVALPLAAIGGINLENAPEVIASGADCICAVSAVVAAADSKKAMRKFQALFK
jgi:thiamine-phosphate pyrophosphorylase